MNEKSSVCRVVCKECRFVDTRCLPSEGQYWTCRASVHRRYQTVCVSGTESVEHDYCHNINPDGQCEDFEPKPLGFWRSLFRIPWKEFIKTPEVT